MQIKRFIKSVLPYWKPTVQQPLAKVWLGNMYGGFYVSPDVLPAQPIVYSFGVGTDITFDQEISEKYDAQVFGFDPTPKSVAWINTIDLPSAYTFYPYGIYIYDGDVSLHLPKDDGHVSGSLLMTGNVKDDAVTVPVKQFATIAQELGHQTIDVLKMDIEGAEYEVIEDILQSGIEIKQIAIEFHHRFMDGGKDKTVAAIQALNEQGYQIFGISPTGEEVSFIKMT